MRLELVTETVGTDAGRIAVALDQDERKRCAAVDSRVRDVGVCEIAPVSANPRLVVLNGYICAEAR